MGRVMTLLSKKPNVSSARRSNRPPVELDPGRINLDAAKAAAAPPPNNVPSNVQSEPSASVGVEIINRPAPPSDAKNKSGEGEKKN